MDRNLSQLCDTAVRCGEKHQCLFQCNYEDLYTIQKPAEWEETENKPDTRLNEIYSGNFDESSVTIYSNLREKNVEGSSSRKEEHLSLLAGSSNNACSLSSRNSSLDSAVSNRKCEVSSRENDSTSQTFWNSTNIYTQTTLASTVFSFCEKEPGKFDPTKNILKTSNSTRVDIDSFSSNSDVEFNSKQSQESMKDSAVAGVPAILTRSHKSDGKLKHICDLSPRQIEHKSTSILHYRTYTKENSYKCDTCGKQFTQKRYLKSHCRIHTGIKPFNCDVCGKEFNQKCNLNTHYRIHTGKKPFACETCGKRFTEKRGLDIHFRTHTGERPFECDICKKRFADKNNLRRHAKVAHTQERLFKCEVCGKSFKSNRACIRHQNEH